LNTSTKLSPLTRILNQQPVLLLFIFICASVQPLSAETSFEKIVFSIPSRSIAAIDIYIAKEKGFFREEGIDVDIVQIRGNVAIAAALSGQVHASNGVGTVIRGFGAQRVAAQNSYSELKAKPFLARCQARDQINC
jgi:ABC-type nitrate/sulfonate/bicarbonate transport system substrate-binding protein